MSDKEAHGEEGKHAGAGFLVGERKKRGRKRGERDTCQLDDRGSVFFRNRGEGGTP